MLYEKHPCATYLQFIEHVKSTQRQGGSPGFWGRQAGSVLGPEIKPAFTLLIENLSKIFHIVYARAYRFDVLRDVRVRFADRPRILRIFSRIVLERKKFSHRILRDAKLPPKNSAKSMRSFARL